MNRWRAALVPAMLSLAATLSGCRYSPSLNIVGSYFPAWILCMACGILLAALARSLFRRRDFERQLRPLPLIYGCIACIFTCVIWLIFFG